MLATHLPLPRRLAAGACCAWRCAAASPTASFSWSGTADVPERYAASGVLQRFGIAAQEDIPGATGVSGTFDLTRRMATASSTAAT